MSLLQRHNSFFVPSVILHPTSFGGAGSTITNIVFGILALVVGIVTIWLAYRTYHVWHPTTTDVDLEASGAEELETGTERRNENSISLQSRTSQERQTSNGGDSDVSMGLPPQHTTELPEVD